jgi:hypothetical protein
MTPERFNGEKENAFCDKKGSGGDDQKAIREN